MDIFEIQDPEISYQQAVAESPDIQTDGYRICCALNQYAMLAWEGWGKNAKMAHSQIHAGVISLYGKGLIVVAIMNPDEPRSQWKTGVFVWNFQASPMQYKLIDMEA